MESMQRYFFPFESFSAEFRGNPITREPLHVKSIKEIALMAFKPAGSFQLNIQKIGLYR